MGRPKKNVPPDTLRALAGSGKSQKEISRALGVSIPTLSRRMAELRAKEGPLLQYREVRGLQLTELQARVLEAITPEKIEDASLLELAKSFKILLDKEMSYTIKKGRITGLLGYLLELEKESVA